MRVLIADRLPDSARTRLQGAGLEVFVDADLSAEGLTAALQTHRPDALIVRSTKVTAAHFECAPSLELVVRAGAGVNNIDLEAASSRGVFVASCPGMNAAAVAELTFGHILNADRRIADNVSSLRAGDWQKKTFSKAQGIKGRTLGVLGCGNIGRAVIQRARAFEMPVVAWSRSLDDDAAQALGVQRGESPLDVARRCDVLTVHLALTASTRGLVGSAILEALGPGALFINTSRGEIVDEAALARAITERGLRAGLDVFSDEPSNDGPCTVELAGLSAVYGSHHIGAATQQAQDAVAHEACRVIEAFRATGVPPNCVNLSADTTADALLVVRHADRVGVLAGVLTILREAEINVQGMENIIFAGGEAACARIQIEGEITDPVIERLRADSRVFDARAVRLAQQPPQQPASPTR